MPGTVALAFAGALILLGIDQFISFFVEQGIEGFLHTGTNKISQIVLY